MSQGGFLSSGGKSEHQHQGDSGGPISPTAGIIYLLGDGVNIQTSGDPITSTLTFSLIGNTAVWKKIIASQTLVNDHGYICVSPGGALLLTLPPVSEEGTIIEVALKGAASWSILQTDGQSIEFGNTITTVGIGGSITSTQQGDTLRMVCITADLVWIVLSGNGNPNII